MANTALVLISVVAAAFLAIILAPVRYPECNTHLFSRRLYILLLLRKRNRLRSCRGRVPIFIFFYKFFCGKGTEMSCSRIAGIPQRWFRISADMVVMNSTIYTSDPSLPFAQAMAVRDGRILQVGSYSSIKVSVFFLKPELLSILRINVYWCRSW